MADGAPDATAQGEGSRSCSFIDPGCRNLMPRNEMEFTTQPPESRASRRGGAEIASGLR